MTFDLLSALVSTPAHSVAWKACHELLQNSRSALGDQWSLPDRTPQVWAYASPSLKRMAIRPCSNSVIVSITEKSRPFRRLYEARPCCWYQPETSGRNLTSGDPDRGRGLICNTSTYFAQYASPVLRRLRRVARSNPTFCPNSGQSAGLIA